MEFKMYKLRLFTILSNKLYLDVLFSLLFQRFKCKSICCTDALKSLLDENLSQTRKVLAEQLEVDQTTVSRRLHKMTKLGKLGKWVPYELSENSIGRRLNSCISLLVRQPKHSLDVKARENILMIKLLILLQPPNPLSLVFTKIHYETLLHFEELKVPEST
uniref:HTH_11 domain-containing protein n=1 Tax=Heterorhabditis bacteriophora TaxID=37862 RepID=A0A1I7WYB4_HETBA